jgi:hypothetical protein
MSASLQRPFYQAQIVSLQRPPLFVTRTTVAIMQITNGPYVDHVGEVDVSRGQCYKTFYSRKLRT